MGVNPQPWISLSACLWIHIKNEHLDINISLMNIRKRGFYTRVPWSDFMCVWHGYDLTTLSVITITVDILFSLRSRTVKLHRMLRPAEQTRGYYDLSSMAKINGILLVRVSGHNRPLVPVECRKKLLQDNNRGRNVIMVRLGDGNHTTCRNVIGDTNLMHV